jgi:DNA-binding phage protein
VNERKESIVKNVERVLIATGVALVFSGGIASAAILWTSATAAAAQPGIGTQLAAQLGTNPGTLADNGLHGGADLATAAATYIGITAADLRTQLAAGKSLADIAVANGKTRDGLIAALTAAEQQSISTFVDAKGTAKPGGPGLGGPGGPRGGFGFGVQGDPLAAAATFLGTTTADLRTKMEAGQTLTGIAAAAGKTRDQLVQALVADATAKIEAAKTAGTITAAQATQLESGLTDRMTKLADSTEPAGRGPRR